MTRREGLGWRARRAGFAVAAAMLALASIGPAEARDNGSERFAALIASTDGATKATAYKVKSVAEEYQILRARNLAPGTQSLIIGDDNHPYDMIEATDARGAPVTVWFDIASFYGRGLGL